MPAMRTKSTILCTKTKKITKKFAHIKIKQYFCRRFSKINSLHTPNYRSFTNENQPAKVIKK